MQLQMKTRQTLHSVQGGHFYDVSGHVIPCSDLDKTKPWLSAENMVTKIPQPLKPKIMACICNDFQVYLFC